MAERGDRRARRALAAVHELNLQLAGTPARHHHGVPRPRRRRRTGAAPSSIESGLEGFGRPPEGLVHGIGFAVALAIVVFLHMVIGEMVPKSLAIAAPERTLLALSGFNRRLRHALPAR